LGHHSGTIFFFFLFFLSFLLFFPLRIAALPKEIIASDHGQITKMANLMAKLGVVVAAFFVILPFLEGISANYTLSNLPVANQILTASYVLFSCSYFSTSCAIFFYGRRIVHHLNESISFHESRNIDKALLRQFKKALGTIRPTILQCTFSFSTGAGSVIIMAFARYYIWTSEGWSLTFMVGFIFSSGISTLMFPVHLFVRELILRRKYGPDFSDAGSSTKDNNNNSNVRDSVASAKPVAVGSKVGSEGPTELENKTGDVVMDEFMSSRV